MRNLSGEQIDAIVHVTLVSNVLNFYLCEGVAKDLFRQKLKQKVKTLSDELIEFEKQFYDVFFDKKEDTTAEIWEKIDQFYKVVSKVKIQDMENFKYILQAYQKDPKAINGIVNKILKK